MSRAARAPRRGTVVSMRRAWVALALLAAGIPGARAETITVCADPGPPPWTYWVRDAEGKETGTFVGSSVDILRTAFGRLGLAVEFVGKFPWSRCLRMVEEGRIDFAMDGYRDEERERIFAYSRHYSVLTPQVFFRKQRPVVVSDRAELKRFRGCGMLGASYAHYGLAPEELDLGVNTYEGMVAKLKAGRCDYFVEELEVIVGYRRLGRDFLSDPELGHGPVPGAVGPAKHLLARRDGPRAALLPRLDAVLDAMVRSGEMARIWKRHAPDLPFKP